MSGRRRNASVSIARPEQPESSDKYGHSGDDRPHHHHHPHSVVLAVVSKHRKLVHKREEERATKRKAKFAQLDDHGIGHNQQQRQDQHGDLEALHEAGGELDSPASSSRSDLFSNDVADALDVVDPQVSTVATMTDMARAIVVPAALAGSPPVVHLDEDVSDVSSGMSADADADTAPSRRRNHRNHKHTALDRYVAKRIQARDRHITFLRGVLSGLWVFLKTPLGIIVAIYGVLVIFSGAGLVICLAGWVPGDKDKQVEVFSQATNALFTITGVGFIPWRLRDTYLIGRICHYRNLSNKLRRRRGLAPLDDRNNLGFEAGLLQHPVTTPAAEKTTTDLVHTLPSTDLDDEHMLNPHQAARLRQCQRDFAKSCTWYRATETPTHRAYPIGIAVAVTAFTIGNSLFQCLMCGYMWGYATHYKDRPAWATGTFMPLSFVCGIVSAVLVSVGAKKVKKTQEVIDRFEEAFDKGAGSDGSDGNGGGDDEAGAVHDNATLDQPSLNTPLVKKVSPPPSST